MKNMILFFCLLVLAVSCSAENMMVRQTGTVRYIEIEGGFYGIVGDDGNNYDPVNLPPEFEKDNLRIRFKVTPLKDRVSYRMWGEIVEIHNISRHE